MMMMMIVKEEDELDFTLQKKEIFLIGYSVFI